MTDFYTSTHEDFGKHYDLGLGPVIFAGYATDIAHRAAAGSTARVLETACGTGIVTRALLDTLPVGSALTATDINADRLNDARGKLLPHETVSFEIADAISLPFPSQSFDTVVCQFGVMFFPNKDKSYRETLRVLAPGGRYLFSVWDAHRRNPWGRVAHETLSEFFKPESPEFTLAPFAYHSIDPINESLQAAGFDDIRISVLPLNRSVPEMANFAAGMLFGSPALAEIVRRPSIDPSHVHEALTLAFRREFGDTDAVVPMQAILFSAVRPVKALIR